MANSSLTSYQGGYVLSRSKFKEMLDVDRIKKNPLYTCVVSGGRSSLGGIPFTSHIEGIYNPDAPFSVSLSSDFVDTFELPPQVDALNSVTGWAANMSGKTQFILKSLRMTEQRWNGCTSPEFHIKIDIPIVRKTDAPWSIIKYVVQATSPTLNDYNSQGSQVQRQESAWTIFAPNGYKVNYSKDGKSSDSPGGTYTISLGTGRTCWFLMHNALITNAECSLSGKKYYDGNPVSVTVSLSFKYWRQPMLEDIVQWFPLAR